MGSDDVPKQHKGRQQTLLSQCPRMLSLPGMRSLRGKRWDVGACPIVRGLRSTADCCFLRVSSSFSCVHT